MENPIIKVEIKSTEVSNVDPPTRVFTVTVENENNGTWPETWGSRSELDAFMKGLKVAFNIVGRSDIQLPSVPNDLF